MQEIEISYLVFFKKVMSEGRDVFPVDLLKFFRIMEEIRNDLGASLRDMQVFRLKLVDAIRYLLCLCMVGEDVRTRCLRPW